jgi:hypothetical protein
MKLLMAFLVWIAFAVFLSVGVVKAVHGQPWLLVGGCVAFTLLVAKIGCLSHD